MKAWIQKLLGAARKTDWQDLIPVLQSIFSNPEEAKRSLEAIRRARYLETSRKIEELRKQRGDT